MEALGVSPSIILVEDPENVDLIGWLERRYRDEHRNGLYQWTNDNKQIGQPQQGFRNALRHKNNMILDPIGF